MLLSQKNDSAYGDIKAQNKKHTPGQTLFIAVVGGTGDEMLINAF